MASSLRRAGCLTGTVLLVTTLAAVGRQTAASAACTPITTIPAAAKPPWPKGDALALNGTSTFLSPGAIAWAPQTIAADTVTRSNTGTDTQASAVTLWYSARADTAGYPVNGVLTSVDSGSTFRAAGPDPKNNDYKHLGYAGQLLDGRMLATGFITNFTGLTTVGDSATFKLAGSLSTDKGKTWSDAQPQVTVTNADIPLNGRTVANIQGIRTSGRPIQTTAGTIVIPVYFAMSGGPRQAHFAAVLTASRPLTADGTFDTTDWTFRVSPVNWNQGTNLNETSVVERQDGALLAVTRREIPGTNADLTPVLSYTVSTDQGVTWSSPVPVSFAEQPGCPVNGVLPQLLLLPNGHLVLSSGRPDNWIAVSTDATGRSWRLAQTTYQNRPVLPAKFWYGSSGYTSLVPAGSNKVIQYLDNCKAPNATGLDGCVTGSGYLHGQNYRLIKGDVSVLTPDPGKIDLATKIKQGTVQLTTDMTGAAPPAAVTPPTPYGSAPSAADATRTNYWSQAEGATDGSSAYWSSALSSRTDGTGTYELTLDRTYRLTKLGLALRPGVAATAQLSTSVDGITWTPALPDISTTGDRAMRYYPFDATARHVRITTGATACPADTACSMINELELYSTMNSFENEPAIPRGLTDLACVRVTQPGLNRDPGHDSRFALRLKDSATDSTYCDGPNVMGQFAFPDPDVDPDPAVQKTLEASVYPLAIGQGLQFIIRGKRTSDGKIATAYQLGISVDKHWMVRTGNAWQVLSSTPAVPLNSWTRMRVVATTTGATLTTVDASGDNPKFVAELPKVDTTAFSGLTGYMFASGGKNTTGDEAVFDDITFD